MSMSRPPRLALRLLETFLPEDARDTVIGDLTEAWEREHAAHNAAFVADVGGEEGHNRNVAAVYDRRWL